MLSALAAEIELFCHQGGWDKPAALFALVPTRTLAADPEAAAAIFGTAEPAEPAGPDGIADSAITPIAQDELPDGPLDEVLAQIGWPPEVVGCALAQEIVMLPPSAESELPEPADGASLDAALSHPDRREARLVVAVLRDGRAASVLRLRARAAEDEQDDLLTGSELAPNLVQALHETLLD